MASAWVERTKRSGQVRYRVRYRVGGRETKQGYLGIFARKQDAIARKNWATAELAAMRVPDLASVIEAAPEVVTFADAVNAWRASRVDTRESTAVQHRTSLNRCAALDPLDVQKITTTDVTELIAALHAAGLAPETIRKSVQAVAMVLDFAGRNPNPARGKHVRLPNSEKSEPTPPTAATVEAVAHRLAVPYLLALAALDVSGARVSELENARLADFDEDNRRWLVRSRHNKNRRPEWRWLDDEYVNGSALWNVLLPRLPAREDRNPEAPLLDGVTQTRLRTAINRACRDAGVPQFSPHDLRHRRISLLHARGVTWARIGERVGQKNIATTANVYSHVLTDQAEANWSELLKRARGVLPPVPPRA